MQFDGPNVFIFVEPPLSPDVINGIGLELQFPVDEAAQFPLFYNTQLVDLFAPAPCIADWNEDGQVNILDFLAFQNSYVLKDPDADINQDGVHNILDFLAFQNKWQEGCAQQPQVKVWTDFESFDLGSSCQGDWGTWDNNGACGTITDGNSRSGEQCLRIDVEDDDAPGDDVVRVIEGADSGLWHFRYWQYIPSEATGTGWLVLMNTYEHNGPKDYSGIVAFDADTGFVIDDPLNQQEPPQLPLITDQWVPIDVEVDLDNDICNYFYAGQPLVTGKSWSAGVGGVGQTSFEAIDFYAGEPGEGGISHWYVDDVTVIGQD